MYVKMLLEISTGDLAFHGVLLSINFATSKK